MLLVVVAVVVVVVVVAAAAADVVTVTVAAFIGYYTVLLLLWKSAGPGAAAGARPARPQKCICISGRPPPRRVLHMHFPGAGHRTQNMHFP